MEHGALEGRCPVEVALDVVGGKWKPMIIWRLCAGTLRFGELQRAIPDVSQRILTLQLRELERDGLVTRTVYPEVPPRVEYSATETARRLEPVLRGLGQWMLDNYGEVRGSKDASAA
jgi:DNA-binding HxlR family transcriptional regulator